jgi:hypothetical protein
MRTNDLPNLKNLSPEEELLFTCTRQSLLSCHRARLAQIAKQHRIHWDVVYTTALMHGVAPLVYANLLQCPAIAEQMPADCCTKFARCTRSNKLLKPLFRQRARSILEFFARRSLKVMLIKGAALDVSVYRQPWYTLSADIDLMVQCRQKDFPAADRQGVHQLVEGRSALERRIDVEFEWFGHHDVSMNGLLRVSFDEIWAEARPVQFLDQVAFLMSPEHMLLSACINGCRKRFFRLKGLCDISEIIMAHEINWDLFTRTARRWGCEIIAYTALLIVGMTLGTSVPESVLASLEVSPLRRQLIHFLSQRMSFSSLAALQGSWHFLNRQLGVGLLLPYTVYRWRQLYDKWNIVWRSRNLCRS